MATAAAVANDCECFADEQEDEEVAVSFEVVADEERLSTAEAVAVFVKKSEEASFSNSSSAKIII